jgi:uncharacterized protein YvpB
MGLMFAVAVLGILVGGCDTPKDTASGKSDSTTVKVDSIEVARMDSCRLANGCDSTSTCMKAGNHMVCDSTMRKHDMKRVRVGREDGKPGRDGKHKANPNNVLYPKAEVKK